jgi:hypothetical protein
VTVVNAGTITGSRDAVQFAAGYANRLGIDPGAVFSGNVTGGNAIGAGPVSTLELASGASAGALSGLGTQFVDFAQVTVDGGAQWIFDATDTLDAGDTLTNAGTLSGAQTLAAGSVLSNASTGTVTASGEAAVYGATGGSATIFNAGVISNTDTSDGNAIELMAGGSVTNQSGGTISGYFGVWGKNVAFTVVNAGTIAGNTTRAPSSGVLLNENGSVTNQVGGVISGFNGI